MSLVHILSDRPEVLGKNLVRPELNDIYLRYDLSFLGFLSCLIGPRPDGYNKLMQYYDASPTRQIRRDKYTIIRSAILEKLTPLFKFHLKDRRYALKEDHSLVCLPIFDGKYQFYCSLFARTTCHFKSFVDFTDA